MKEPTCAECKGACCEFIAIQTRDLELPGNKKWWKLHGLEPRVKEQRVILGADCSMLDPVAGVCIIYPTRPKACRVFLRGGPECLDAIELRRPRYAARLRRG